MRLSCFLSVSEDEECGKRRRGDGLSEGPFKPCRCRSTATFPNSVVWSLQCGRYPAKEMKDPVRSVHSAVKPKPNEQSEPYKDHAMKGLMQSRMEARRCLTADGT